jgi:elongation factor G
MDEERDRGITISLAAITYPWLGHQVNLIDTPSHVHFTEQ